MDNTGIRVCRTCKQGLPISAYNPHSARIDGLRVDCKKCRNEYAKLRRRKIRASNPLLNRRHTKMTPEERKAKIKEYWQKNNKKVTNKYNINKGTENWMRNKYGISIEQYITIVESQDRKCAICDKKIIEEGLYKSHGIKGAQIDHCHKTGKIRGLLCGQCNRAIGLLKEDLTILQRAIGYLSS